EFVISRFIKPTAHCQIADARADHIDLADRRLRYRTANDLNRALPVGCGIFGNDLSGRAFRASEEGSDLVERLAQHRFTIDVNDLVAVFQPGKICGSSGKRRLDVCRDDLTVRFAEIADGGTNTEVFRVLVRSKLLVVL